LQLINSCPLKILFKRLYLLQIISLSEVSLNIVESFKSFIFAFSMLIYSNFEHKLNKFVEFLESEVFIFDKSKETNDEQLENIKSIFETFDVSKCDKFNKVKDVQL
jgi:hypothetical protein